MLDNDDIHDQMGGKNGQLLHLRINASGKNIEKNSIESIIFVETEDVSTVWCAVGNRIKIFNSNSWTYDTPEIKIKEKIVNCSY